MAAIFPRALLVLFLGLALGAPQVSAAGVRPGTSAVAMNVIQNICARCHDTSVELKTVPSRLPGVAPAFLAVAADPKMDQARLMKFLTFPHGEMDNVFLTRRETVDVADYILSLRRK